MANPNLLFFLGLGAGFSLGIGLSATVGLVTFVSSKVDVKFHVRMVCIAKKSPVVAENPIVTHQAGDLSNQYYKKGTAIQ
jgi:hypothetical protein